MKLRNDAATKIQKNYLTWRRWSLIPKALKFRKNQMATIIQKYMRGDRICNSMYTKLRKTKLQQNLRFFYDMKYRIEYVAINRIKLFYLIYLRHKKMQERIELQNAINR